MKVVCFSAVGPGVRGGQASRLKDCGGRLHAKTTVLLTRSIELPSE